MSATETMVEKLLLARSILRDKYIDLHGIKCILYTANEGIDNRQNLYGELETNLQFTTSSITISVELSALMQIIQARTTEIDNFDDGDLKLEVVTKLNDIINIGDRIEIPYTNIGIRYTKVFQVSNVQVSSHVIQYKKIVILVPLRDI